MSHASKNGKGTTRSNGALAGNGQGSAPLGGDAAAAPPPAPSHVRPKSIYSHPSLSQQDLMRISVEAGIAQPRTVVRYLRGDPVQSSTRGRIEKVLATLDGGRFARFILQDVGEAPPASSRSR